MVSCRREHTLELSTTETLVELTSFFFNGFSEFLSILLLLLLLVVLRPLVRRRRMQLSSVLCDATTCCFFATPPRDIERP